MEINWVFKAAADKWYVATTDGAYHFGETEDAAMEAAAQHIADCAEGEWLRNAESHGA